jgi:hypothetical protein
MELLSLRSEFLGVQTILEKWILYSHGLTAYNSNTLFSSHQADFTSVARCLPYWTPLTLALVSLILGSLIMSLRGISKGLDRQQNNDFDNDMGMRIASEKNQTFKKEL